MKRKFLILTGFLMATTVGCSDNVKSIDFYEKNDEAREQKIMECRNKNFDDMSKKQQEDCENAQKAGANIAKFNMNITTFRTELASICVAQFSNGKECSEYVDKCFLDGIEGVSQYDELVAKKDKCIEEYTSKNK